MLEFTQNLGRQDMPATESLTLDYEARGKARQRVVLNSGTDACLFLERGHVLAEGDILQAEDGTLALVQCQAEPVVLATAQSWPVLCRACYHLGNRHAPLGIGNLQVVFQPDAVLEALAVRLGLSLIYKEAPFMPEQGAYGGHGHAH